MTTIYTCTEPKDAWSLVSHFLANQLLIISLACEAREKLPDDKVLRDENEATISRAHLILSGDLFFLVHKMKAYGHADDSAKIQQILGMIVDQDVTKPEVREAIHAKNRELNAGKREFDAAMVVLRVKGAFQS